MRRQRLELADPGASQKHRVIAVDIRGHGRSAAPDTGYTPRAFADDIAKLLERLEAGQVIAMGHSLGGMIIAALAVEHPGAVRALVPVDAAYGMDAQLAPLLEQLIAGLNSPACHDVALGLFATFYPPASPPHLAVLHARRLRALPAHVIAQTFEGLAAASGQFAMKPEAEAYLGRVTAPALSFRSGSASAAAAGWERAQFQHSCSKAVAWDGTRHFLHQERPAEFNALVEAWIDGLPG